MDIRCDSAILDGKRGRATQRHVLADRCDRFLDLVADRLVAPRERSVGKGLDVAIDGKRRLRRPGDQRLEGVVAGDEVGFGVQLDHRRTGAFRRHADKTFGRDAAGLLGGLRQTLGAQPVDGRVHVAVVLCKGSLAVHHAHAGLFAELFHHRCGNAHRSPR